MKRSVREAYKMGNADAAHIIVDDERYQGALREWALIILAQCDAEQPQEELFDAA